jgi:hypothetical protein
MTFGAIKDRIADELVRPELASQIALAVNDAIREAAKARFWFNEVRGLFFPMVTGQGFYDSAASANIPLIGRIDALWIVAQGQRRNLDAVNALDIAGWEEGQTTLTGEPFAYARQANGLLFWMAPNDVYPVYIDGTTRFAPLVNDSDENPYLTEGETYVRALAKATLLEDVIRDFDEADRQWAKAEREKRVLLAETSGRLSTNRNAAYL